MGERLANRCELGPCVGKGAFSVVYDATDRATGRSVAIKRVTSENLEDAYLVEVRRRFDREAAALSVISSVHVVELISARNDDESRVCAKSARCSRSTRATSPT